MMVLRWCDDRWKRPRERARAEARLAAIDAKAVGLGLRPEMELAASDNARKMATMRLDTRCSGGFDRSQEAAEKALTARERLMESWTKSP
jgi:hypothetical protein